MPISPDRAVRGGRRRRLLIDGGGDSSKPNRRTRRTSRSAATKEWADDARDDCQPAITELIPQRKLTFACLALLVVLSLAAVVGLLHLSDVLAQSGGVDPRWSAVASRAADWVVGSLCLATAGYCATVYSIRRHRTSDYHGRYRTWRWVVLILVLASADVASGASRLAIERFAGTSAGPLATLLPLAAAALLALFLARELARVKSVVAFLLAAGIVQMLRTTRMAEQMSAELVLSAATCDALLRLVAASTMFLGLVGYARRLRLEANGRFAPRKASDSGRPKRRQDVQRVESPDKSEEVPEETPPTIPLESAKQSQPREDSPQHGTDRATPQDRLAEAGTTAEKKERRRRRKEKRRRKRAA